jgi:hypothetical protein
MFMVDTGEASSPGETRFGYLNFLDSPVSLPFKSDIEAGYGYKGLRISAKQFPCPLIVQPFGRIMIS